MITSGSPAATPSARSDDHGLVVVGVEDAPQSQAALCWAVKHAQRTGARVLAVTAWSATPYLMAGPDMAAAGALTEAITDGQLQAAAQERLRLALATLPPDAEQLVDRAAMPGDPATVLVDAARDADLLVLGNARRGAFASAVTGSVAARCAHHATCPVVLVPDPARCGER